MSFSLHQELLSVVRALEASGIEYALCGGLAVAVHGAPRATKDIDLLMLETALPAALVALRPIGYLFEAGIIPFGTGTTDERHVFRVSKIIGEDVLTLDLMLVSPSLRLAWERRIRVQLPDTTLCVVALPDLLEMKRVAGRLIDLGDIERLGEVHGSES